MSPTINTSPNPLHIFVRQSVEDDASSAAHTLSSWDNCMAEDYCKWPVIVAIIIAALIALSVISCLVRFCCCGMECCCWCCSCINHCCPSPRRKQKYSAAPQSQPYQYPPQQPYGYHNQMSYAQVSSQPQFATFESSGPKRQVTEDSLPAMPSWETSRSMRVEDNTPQHNTAGGVIKDDEPMRTIDEKPEQMYEDPDESSQPMLGQGQQTSAPSNRYASPKPYPQQAQGYAQRNQAPQRSMSRQQGGQYYAGSEYTSDGASSYAYTDSAYAAGDYSDRQPQHQYGIYPQQQDAYGYGQDAYNNTSYTGAGYAASPPPNRAAAGTPSSNYSSVYPPSYNSRAPTVRSYQRTMGNQNPFNSSTPASQGSVRTGPSQIPRVPTQIHSQTPAPSYHTTSPATERGTSMDYAEYPPSQSTAYAPSSTNELPGSLVAGGPQGPRYYGGGS